MDALLSQFQRLGLPCEIATHSAAMTVEEQAAALKDRPGSVTKNLFLKDKRGRLYIVSALPDTTIDLKVLSARLGAGKGGVRMAPDELLPSVLGVALGSVTPLAVAHPSATDVVLLLDGKLKAQATFYVHPLQNTASLAMSPVGLETFLADLKREAHWVDLEADPKIDRDNPPDLKHIADAAKPIVSKEGEEGAAEARAAAVAAAPKAAAAATAGKGGKKSGEDKKAAEKAAKAAAAAAAARAASDVYAVTDIVVGKAAVATGVELSGVDGDVLRKLRADVVMELNALRNAAYAAGFKAAQGAMMGHLRSDF